MFKNAFLYAFFFAYSLSASAATYFMAPNGDDNNPGTIDAPFATLNKVQSVIASGDTVYFRGGTYMIQESQIMGESAVGPYKRVFLMNKAGSPAKKTCYWGYPGERPVFDLSQVKPAGYRVTVFYVSASDLHFKNFEIVGTQVTITTSNTQSECFRHDGGNRNIYENLAMHDGMAIGFYLVRGLNNLVLNCDAYNNYDYVSQAGGGINGGNVDGFGGHTNGSAGSTGNVFRGCRAWYNSDDGFDLIGSITAFTIENCWAFYNGYKPPGYGNLVSAGDGTGFKAGGYGMGTLTAGEQSLITNNSVPMHVVKNCLAYYNKNRGFYANHHLGGIYWENNTGYRNPHNFDMTTRARNDNPAIAVDVPGYGHTLKNNVSYLPRTAGRDVYFLDEAASTVQNNTFLPAMSLSNADFMSLDETELTAPRQADGGLPVVRFLRSTASSALTTNGMGYLLYDISLPVNFGSVSAAIDGNKLSVFWTSLSEQNNSHFEIEASADGSDFRKIGEVLSKAASGNSAQPINYEFEMDLASASFVASLLLGMLGVGMSGKRRKNRLLIIATGIALLSFYACTKQDHFSIDSNQELYIRIKQIDKDGGYKYSRIVKALMEA